MNIYYIDYENVNSFGLKGAQLLGSDSKIYILYSKKADNVKIDIRGQSVCMTVTKKFEE